MTTAEIVERLAPMLADPAGALLACDYDGTLAPIVDDPALASPSPGAVDALAALAGRLGQVAVVTGRPAADAVRLAGLDAVPGLVVLGLYGAQRWAAGQLTTGDPAPEVAAAEQEAAALVATADPGVRLESKGASFAVHARRAADPAGELERLLPLLQALADRHRLHLARGRLVLELLAGGDARPDKGTAIAALAAERPARSVLYLGDDLGDLAAFAACEQLRRDGVAAWSVAARSAEAPEVARRADLVVDGPAGVVDLLSELARRLG